MSSEKVEDEGGPKKYFAAIPHVVSKGSKSELSVYAKWLYVYLKAVAGESGTCWQSTTTIAEGAGMSQGAVSKAKKELKDAGLITRESPSKKDAAQGSSERITIIDVWPQNMQEFSGSHNEQGGQTSSSDESTSSYYESSGSSDETKKNPSKENPSKKAAHAHETDGEKAVRIFAEELRTPREVYDEGAKIKQHTDWNPEKLNVWRQVCYDTSVDMKDAANANLKYLFRDFDEEWQNEREDTRSMMDKMPGPPAKST